MFLSSCLWMQGVLGPSAKCQWLIIKDHEVKQRVPCGHGLVLSAATHVGSNTGDRGLLRRGHADMVHEGLALEREGALRPVRRGDAQVCAVAVVLEDHDTLAGCPVVHDVDTVGLHGAPQDDALAGPMHQIGGGDASTPGWSGRSGGCRGGVSVAVADELAVVAECDLRHLHVGLVAVVREIEEHELLVVG